MTEDDYKELMKFHIMLSDYDLSDQRYAAVDPDGGLYTYQKRPSSTYRQAGGNLMWTPREEVDNINIMTSNYKVIAVLPLPINWTKTLIRI